MEILRDRGKLEVAIISCDWDWANVIFWVRGPLNVCSSEVWGAGERGWLAQSEDCTIRSHFNTCVEDKMDDVVMADVVMAG